MDSDDRPEHEDSIFFARVPLSTPADESAADDSSLSEPPELAGDADPAEAVRREPPRISGWGGHRESDLPDPGEEWAVHPLTASDVVDQPSTAASDVDVVATLLPSHLVSEPVVSERSADNDVAPSVKPEPRSGASRRSDPVSQSFMLLLTLALMLLAARFAVPRIVEEVRYAWHRGELRAEYETGSEGLRNVSLDTLSQAYQMVTSAVGPSVVHIDVQRDDDSKEAGAKFGFGSIPSNDQGSGVIVDAGGYVLTNRHVIHEGNNISVTLSDGRTIPATVVGSDLLTDIAVLKIDTTGLLPIAWGDSEKCKVGSPVWAVGSPFGLDRTVTFGILSGKHRVVQTGSQHGASVQYQDFMQSDVAVNPGNSGGPLVDARGTLVGINTAIVGDTYQGVSFSIPSNIAKQVYEKLRQDGFVERGWLGVSLVEVSDDRLQGDDARLRGALVSTLTAKDSPAAKAGVKVGDIIVRVKGHAISNVSHLMRVIGSEPGGSTVVMHLIRGQQPIELKVRLGSRQP